MLGRSLTPCELHDQEVYSIHRADSFGHFVGSRLYILIRQKLTTTTFGFVDIV